MVKVLCVQFDTMANAKLRIAQGLAIASTISFVIFVINTVGGLLPPTGRGLIPRGRIGARHSGICAVLGPKVVAHLHHDAHCRSSPDCERSDSYQKFRNSCIPGADLGCYRRRGNTRVRNSKEYQHSKENEDRKNDWTMLSR